MFEFLTGKLEGRRVGEQPLKKGYQIDQDKGNKIYCFYINVRSIRNKFLELRYR